MLTVPEAPVELPEWREPWRTGGLIHTLRQPWLLWHLVLMERGDRYKGTLLGGMFWAFAQPLTRFFMYYVIVGQVLGLVKRVPNFGIYVFCGIVMAQFFNAALKSGTRSMARSTSLLRKVNLPREAIPATAVLSQIMRLGPASVILLIVAVLTGWRPNHLVGVPYAIAGITLVTVFLIGLGLLLSVGNAYVRDISMAVSLVTMLTHWISPVMYPLDLVTKTLGSGALYTIYVANPLTIAMFGLRQTFWYPTVPPPLAAQNAGSIPAASIVLSIAIALGTLGAGIVVAHRFSHRLVLRGKWSS
ncbi:MAG: ABC transporter permease [Actinomycetes bacterium]